VGHRNSIVAGVSIACAAAVWAISDSYSLNFLIPVPFLVGSFLVTAIQGPKLKDGSVARFYDLLGKLSYPVFLLHYAAGTVAAALTGLRTGYLLLAVTTPIVILASLAVYLAVERPIERLRKAIREREQSAVSYPLGLPQ
jgi:peptidoglycan/LPS O-acetylase OafA/YrhL